MTIKTVYKSVFRNGANYYSWSNISPYFPSQLSVKYEINTKSFPIEETYLFAFEDYLFAKYLNNNVGSSQFSILRCEAEVVEYPYYVKLKDTTIYCLDVYCLDMLALNEMVKKKTFKKDLAEFFKGYPPTFEGISTAPVGTVFCEWILPLEIVPQ